jgi:hypothetical protein
LVHAQSVLLTKSFQKLAPEFLKLNLLLIGELAGQFPDLIEIFQGLEGRLGKHAFQRFPVPQLLSRLRLCLEDIEESSKQVAAVKCVFGRFFDPC